MIAADLAANGWAVAIHCNRSEEPARALAHEIMEAGGHAAVFRADLADEAETVALVPRVVDEMGPLHALVNNASVFERDAVETVTPASWTLHLDVNLKAPFFLTQAFAAQVPAGEAGNVVNIVDQRVLNLTPHFTSYTVSKAGLWALTQTLALALAPSIRVNAVGPGPVLPSARQTEDQFSHQWSQVPLARPVDPAEIARALRFILDAPSMTGQMITLDGGQHLGWGHCPYAADPGE